MASPSITDAGFKPLTGHCSCNAISFSITALPLITHICYCTWCQREAGSAFGLNVLIESYHVHRDSPPTPGDYDFLFVDGPTPSGNGQTVARCPKCFDGLFKYYGNSRHMTYVKAGTLDAESFNRVMAGEKVHIYTSTKPEWMDLEEERKKSAGVFEEYYVREEVWQKGALERRIRLLERTEAERGGKRQQTATGDDAGLVNA